MIYTKSSCRPITSSRLSGGFSKKSVRVTWSGTNNITNGEGIWSDGTDIYYTYDEENYILNKSTNSWDVIEWNISFTAYGIWTDGTNVYFSSGTNHYLLDKENRTWSPKVWEGLAEFYGAYIWTDGTNIYHMNQYGVTHKLNVDTSTWEEKIWKSVPSNKVYFYGGHVWTDGTNIYVSADSTQYVLDVETDSWVAKTWEGLSYSSSYLRVDYVWSDGVNVYADRNGSASNVYTLNKETGIWESGGISIGYPDYLWTDGTNIYWTRNSVTYILLPDTAKLYQKGSSWTEIATMQGSPTPTNVETESEMTALLTTSVEGVVYKYTGTNGTYKNGVLYQCVNGEFKELIVRDDVPTQEKTVDIGENCTVEVTPDEGYLLSKVIANVTVPNIDYPLPIEIATEAEMNTLLETAEVGAVYKYTGETTDTYENGALYIVESDTVKLSQPTISVEETYIKGNAVENVKYYKLLSVTDAQYTDIGEQRIGKQTDGFNRGYVADNGAFVNDETSGWKYTEFIHIDKLADVDGACVMLTPDSDNIGRYVANFYADDDTSMFVGGLTYNDMNSIGFTAADVVYYAQSKNAKYVVFSSRWQSAESLWVNLTNAIFFCLDEYPSSISSGKSHTLVVQAIGDGDIYEDSDYSNEVVYTDESNSDSGHSGGSGN